MRRRIRVPDTTLSALHSRTHSQPPHDLCSRIPPTSPRRQRTLRLERPRDRVLPQPGAARRARGWQAPHAIILGCSDSRVPVEIVFDQGLGDLFVIRVAGNIVAPSLVGSVEYAAECFGTRLVVVLGHSRCGAVIATSTSCSVRREPVAQPPLDRRPRASSVAALLSTELRHDREALVEQAVRANIRASADHLRHGSEVLEQLIARDGLLVVGAEYSVETGLVEFFDGVPTGT